MLALVLTLAAHAATADTSSAPLARQPADSVPAVAVAAPLVAPAPAVALARPVAPDTGEQRRRARAIEYSDWYARRLAVHRVASYTMLPLFALEYVYGQRLITQQEGAATGTDFVHSDTKNIHALTAGGIATLFGVNTVTGLWNLYDSRKDPANRGLRVTHTVLMLAADAGFAATGLLAGRAGENGAGNGRPGSGARLHRNVAFVSMGVGTIGTAIMWFRRD